MSSPTIFPHRTVHKAKGPTRFARRKEEGAWSGAKSDQLKNCKVKLWFDRADIEQRRPRSDASGSVGRYPGCLIRITRVTRALRAVGGVGAGAIAFDGGLQVRFLVPPFFWREFFCSGFFLHICISLVRFAFGPAALYTSHRLNRPTHIFFSVSTNRWLNIGRERGEGMGSGESRG
jgi:hypothetical protein